MEKTKTRAVDLRKFSSCSVEELYRILGTGRGGLSAVKAGQLLNEYGQNVLPEQARPLFLVKFLGHLKNLFNVLLLVAAGLCLFVGVSSNDPTSLHMSYAIIAVVMISILFTIFQENRAQSAVDAIKELVPKNAKVLRGGKLEQVQISDIVPGDIVYLEEGDKVPADARIVESFSLAVDNIILTGESDLQRREAVSGASAYAEDLYKCKSLLFASTTIGSGNAYAVVIATGANTEFGRIVSMAQDIRESESPLQRQLDGAARLNFTVAIAVGIAFFIASILLLHLSLMTSILFMIGVMICLVPEGLQITVTLSLALSSQAMSRRNVVVKRLSSVETLGSCTVICSDKTGTITEGQMTVRLAWSGGERFDVSGEGYGPEGAITSGVETLRVADREVLRLMCEVAALDNTATLVPPLDRRKSRWAAVGDTTDAALLAFAIKGGLPPKTALADSPRIGMIPFDSTRKMMSSIHRVGSEVTCYTKGAVQAVLPRCSSILWQGKPAPMTDEMVARVSAQTDAFAKEAFRVLALAYRILPGESEKYNSDSHEREMTFIGLVAIYDPPRPEVPEALHKARMAGIRIVMITGDHELTAEAIARKCGIVTGTKYRVVTGAMMNKMSGKQLASVLRTRELVFARTTPEQKLRIVRTLRAMGETVAVTGDGVNDAPSLLEADIGVAMGITGTDVARESSDMVLLDDNFASIVNGIEEGRAVFDNLKKFIVYVFCHNWSEMMAFLAFVLLGCPLPLAVIQVLLIDLFLEIPTGLSLTSEAPEPGIMEAPPRKRTAKLFDRWAMARAAYIGTITGIYTLMWVFYFWSNSGWSGESEIEDVGIYYTGMAMMTVGVVAGQLGVLFAMRTGVRSSFEVSLRKNRWLAYAALIEFLGIVFLVNLPRINTFFMLSPIDPIYWLALYLIAPTILLIEEGRKAAFRAVSRVPAAARVAPLPFASGERAILPSHGLFTERSKPAVLVTGSLPDVEDVFAMARVLGGQTGSKLIVAQMGPSKAEDWVLNKFEITTMKRPGTKAPVEHVHIPPEKDLRRQEAALHGLIDSSGADTLILTVPREAFTRKGYMAKRYPWLRKHSGKRVILVSPPAVRTAKSDGGEFRIMIPVLTTFHEAPFTLAATLTENRAFPNIDVIAAKVVEMPAITPLYSFYRPESLVDTERQMSFLSNLKGWALLNVMHSKIVLVRNTVRDFVEFAADRKADMVLLGGDWGHERTGFITGLEREIARNTRSDLVVVLPPNTAS